jgi:hypothetical protein
MADEAVNSMGDLGTQNGTRGLLYNIADMKTINTQDLADRVPEEGRQEFLDTAGGHMDFGFILQSPTLCVSHCKVAPNVTVKPHHHGVNQITYVLNGELKYGRQVARPGMGYFTPAKRYTWTSGPEGAEFLEITDAPPQIPITTTNAERAREA